MQNKPIILIAAMNKERVIGIGDQLPWDISSELQHFKKTTQDSVLIIGNNTYQSLPPLPGRQLVVVSTREVERTKENPSIYSAKSFKEAKEMANKSGKLIFLAGGSMLYKSALTECSYALISEIEQEVDTDSYPHEVYYFPELGKEWKIVKEEHLKTKENEPKVTIKLYRNKNLIH